MKYLYRFLSPPTWPIATKISVALVSATLIPMGFATYYNMADSLERVESSEYRKLELLATSTASRLDQLIMDIKRVVSQISSDRHVVGFLAASPRQREALHPNLQQTLENISNTNEDVDAVFILDQDGRAVATTDQELVGGEYAFREYFRSSLEGKPYVSSILVGKTTGRPGMFFSSPVRSLSGKILGVTVLKIRGKYIQDIVNALQIDSQNYAFLIDEDGIIISHPQQSYLYQSLLPLSPKTLKQITDDKRYGLAPIKSLNLNELQVMVQAKKPGNISYRDSQISRRVGFAPLEQKSWVLAVSQPEAQFVAPLQRLKWLHGTSVVVVGIITSGIALFLGRSISQPIHALTAAAHALENDNFDSHVLDMHQSLEKVARSQDDVGQLVRVFLQMSEGVRTRDQNLKMQVQELRIEIDETKRANHLTEITENEHFQQIQKKIQLLRGGKGTVRETETDYYQRLQNTVQSIKERSLNCEDLNLVVGADAESRNSEDEARF